MVKTKQKQNKPLKVIYNRKTTTTFGRVPNGNCDFLNPGLLLNCMCGFIKIAPSAYQLGALPTEQSHVKTKDKPIIMCEQ